jgi:hypothetical protein
MTDLELLQQSLLCLEEWEGALDEDCGDPQCDECRPFRHMRSTLAALRKRLARPAFNSGPPSELHGY